uniref:Uncharacterized protein n=1 Tax=Ursus americanus TaxID=9643 RepID=A0A452QRB1_URSAM
MGQDGVAAWPSPEPLFPSPEGKRKRGTALHPECPSSLPCGLVPWVRAWPLGPSGAYTCVPHPAPQPQPGISPSHCGPGLGRSRHLLTDQAPSCVYPHPCCECATE